jgi:hypothetical protein
MCGIHSRKDLGAVGVAVLETCSWKKFSYVEVKIREIGPRTTLAARLAKQRHQLYIPQGYFPPYETVKRD